MAIRLTHLRPLWAVMRLLLAAFFLVSISSAQTTASGTGIISGRVYNPATGEYVRNAEVRVQGTSRVVTTAGDGSFTIPNVPAGPATIHVSYIGYETASVSVEVTPGGVAKAEVNLTTSAYRASKGEADGEPVKLDTFVVSTQREGNAKAIMDQKQAMTISNIVSAETFGNTAEGNVGEFLKYLPAIQLDYVEADARNPRIRGMPAQYTTVSFAGMNIASADAFIQNNGTDNGGGAGSGGRSFGFEQISMSSVDAVDVSFTTNASQSAGSAAGSIDLRPKHAYETNAQRIALSFSGMMNSEQRTLDKIVRPDDRAHRLLLPNGNFEYANSFFNKRLGVLFSVNESNTYNEQRQFTPTYDANPTATDPRPLVVTRLQYKDGPKFSERTTMSFTFDFKPTEKLTLTLIGSLSNYGMFTSNRVFGVTSTRANIKGDGWLSWGENIPVTAVTNTQSYLRKRTHGYFYIPRFEYKTDTLYIEGTGLVSQSLNDYAGNQSYQLPGNNMGGVTIPTTNITVSASRPADSLYAWKIVQRTGPDWADATNYKAPATGYPTFGYDGRYNREVNLQARVDARYTAPFAMPTWFKAGANILETTYIFRNLTTWQSWNYIGPGGGLGGSWAMYPSDAQFLQGHNSQFISLSGRTASIWDHNTVGELFRSHPEYFVQNATPANFLSSFVNSPKYIREQVDAAYAMFDTQPLPKLEVQGGVRWEQTRDQTRDFTQVPGSQVVAAGFPVNASGLATTIPGMQYQYFSKPPTSRTNKYSDFFPSAGIKYSFAPNLQAMLGYSYTVTRPAFGDLSGTYTENESTQEINAPNPLLKPQYSNNYSARAMYYFEPVGSFGVGVFENDIRSFTQTTRVQGSAGDFGFTDPIYDSYTIITKNNIPGTVIYRGATIEYRQTLSFLPGLFKGLTVFGNYTRTYTKMKVPDPTQLTAPNNPYNFGWIPGVAPHVINGGFSYQVRRLTFGLNARWTADMPTTTTRDTWMQQNVKFDMDVSYSLTNHFNLFFYSRNLTNVPDHTYVGSNRDRVGGGRAIEYYGAYFYAGVKATF